MTSTHIADRTRHLKTVAIKLSQAVALAAMLIMALPAHAGDDRAVKSRVPPVYPEIAKRMHIGGAVKLEATVDPDGKVTEVKAISGNHMLSVAAEEAVRQWKFVPGTSASSVNVEVNFNAN